MQVPGWRKDPTPRRLRRRSVLTPPPRPRRPPSYPVDGARFSFPDESGVSDDLLSWFQGRHRPDRGSL